jgi:ribonuclease HI
MTQKKQKYYVVWLGNPAGIYHSWEECQAVIKGVSGAQYMSFESLPAATIAYNKSYQDYKNKTPGKSKVLTPSQKAEYGQPNLYSIAVDAACSGNPGRMEYRAVDTQTHRQLFHQGPFDQATNNVGEFLALVHGLAFLKKEKNDRIIYSDSRIAIAWVKKHKCNTKLKKTNKNQVVFELISRAELWLKNNSYSTFIVKWETKAWGEIPADFGRK